MCSICNGHPGCPCCSSDAPTYSMPCPICNGKPNTYLDAEGEEITKEQYDLLTPKQRNIEPCELCEGKGEVEYQNEYEPEYEHDEQ